MTGNNNTNDKKPIRGSIPSSVRKAGAEARMAEKKTSEDWVHVDDLHELIEQWMDIAAGSEGFASDDYAIALRRCADELEEVIEDDDSTSS